MAAMHKSASLQGHRAGQKIRGFRERHGLTAAEFGRIYGEPKAWPSRTVFGWEAYGKQPQNRAVMLRLQQLGICAMADWLKPALPAATEAEQAEAA